MQPHSTQAPRAPEARRFQRARALRAERDQWQQARAAHCGPLMAAGLSKPRDSWPPGRFRLDSSPHPSTPVAGTSLFRLDRHDDRLLRGSGSAAAVRYGVPLAGLGRCSASHGWWATLMPSAQECSAWRSRARTRCRGEENRRPRSRGCAEARRSRSKEEARSSRGAEAEPRAASIASRPWSAPHTCRGTLQHALIAYV